MNDDPRKYRHRDSRPHTVARRGDLLLKYVGDDAAAITGTPYVVLRVYDSDPYLRDSVVQLASGTLAEMEEVFRARTSAPEPGAGDGEEPSETWDEQYGEWHDHGLESDALTPPEPIDKLDGIDSGARSAIDAVKAELDRVIADMEGGQGFKLYIRGLKRARRIIFEGEGTDQ